MSSRTDAPATQSAVEALSADRIEQLRQQHYNATVEELKLVHDELMIVRVRPDWGESQFEAGQYTTLGLGHWEPRVAGAQLETLKPGQIERLVRRAYSVACGMISPDGQLIRAACGPYLEFYIALVLRAEHPPALTPRLFRLEQGDRIYVGQRFTGHYTLAPVRPKNDVLFLATGTGEAPNNAMLIELLASGHPGRIVSINCVRWKKDLAYESEHRELERRYDNYRYVALTTREPENLDASAPGYVGKVYIQDYIESGRLERETGFPLDPAATHVFLCGNPAMIGLPRHPQDHPHVYPKPRGMAEVLEHRGFRLDEPGQQGSVHCEKYW